jgi:tRNA (guanine-N7-)-methyltransferase
MWVGAKMAQERKLSNAAFIRMIIEKLAEHFEKGEISEIWITFPDPFPKDRHDKHRLTHPRFLKIYKEVLPENGIINFKTDDDGLFNYTESLFQEINIKPIQLVRDVHGTQEADEYVRNISTHYEKLFRARGRTIKFMKFTLDEVIFPV